MSDKEFINGMSAKAPSDRAPDYVKARVSIKLSDFAQYLRELKAKEPDVEWLNADVKVSKGGNWYVERNTWKPQQQGDPNDFEGEIPSQGAADAPMEDDIPFAPYMKGTVA
jgi:hypothetical protein